VVLRGETRCMKLDSFATTLNLQGLQATDAAAELTRMGGARVILATVTSGAAMSAVLSGLAVDGKLVIVGAPAEPLEVPALGLIFGRRSIMGWPSGTSIDSQDTQP
jgi:D-arabinose 1-dehydrogenase-like Zn-dependent alcohol dehydrogenase